MRFLRPALAAVLLLAAAPATTLSSGEAPGPAPADADPFYVDSTAIRYLESWPVQVVLSVSGATPTPCHEPAWAVSDDGAVIDVRLWSEADPGVICATVLQPTEVNIALGDHTDATRDVVLNGEPVGVMQVGTGGGAAPAALTGAGWSFGLCMGYCHRDLAVDGDRVSFRGLDRDAEVPLFVNRGVLTDTGLQALAATTAAIEVSTLQEVYGCPDCADGGAAYLVLRQDGIESRHLVEFGRPPAELGPAYQLTQALMSALETCNPGELVTVDDDCTPYAGR